jgi:hypothetical protein
VSGHLAHGKPVREQLTGLPQVDRLHRAPEAHALRARPREAGVRPLDEARSLLFGDPREHRDQQGSDRPGGVEPGLLDGDELYAGRVEGEDGRKVAGHRAAEAVERPDHEHVEGAAVRVGHPSGAPAGFRVRLDAIGTNASGINLTDFKSSLTAGFTPNQVAGYPLIEANGGFVVGNSGGAAYPAGFPIPPTSVTVIRP